MNEDLESTTMAAKNDYQESQISASSSIRKKVDILNLGGKGNSEELVKQDSKCNFRTSLAWDNAFFTSPGILEQDELFPTLNSRNLDDVIDKLENKENLLSFSQSLEPDINNTVGNVNFRKSLAWDDSFFTSEGVLDPFELAIVNNGYKKRESHLLPVIEDEVWRSSETNSTLDSEGFSLTRLEMELFEDIRASMPKPTTSSFKWGLKDQAKGDGSRTMMKVMPTCRSLSNNKHASKRITRELPNAPKIQLKHSREHHKSCPKPPKASEKANCISRSSTKRASLGDKHARLVSASECPGKSKKPSLRLSCNMIHGSTQSLRSSLSDYPISTNKSASLTKSPPNLRRKVNAQVYLSLPGPASVTPLVRPRANKMEVQSSCQPVYSQYTPTSSSYGSPTSSVDEWSSESSSTSAAKRFIRCKPRLYTSLGSSRLETNASKDPHLEPQVGHDTSQNQPQKKDSRGSGNSNTPSILREIKPSGLRMPSPKLGFFDAENIFLLATKGGSPEGTTVTSSKGVAGRTRCSKLQSPGSLPGSGSKRLGPHKDGGSLDSVRTTRRVSKNKDDEDIGSQARDYRTPTRKPYGRILQDSDNQCLKTQENIVLHPEIDFQIFHDDNKENLMAFVDQVENLTKHVNSIDLNNDGIIDL